MNKFNVFLTAVAFSLVFSSCETSKTPIRELSSLVERVEDKYDEFTDEDWEEIVSEYKKIEKELSEYEFTDKELKEIGKLKAKIYGRMTENAVKDFSKQIEDWGEQLEGGIEELFDELKED